MQSLDLPGLETALLTVLPGAVFHYDAPKGPERYVVYTEFGERSAYADDEEQLCLPVVQIDVITQTEADTLVDSIKSTLKELGQIIALKDTYYDDEIMAVRSVLEITLV